MAKKILLAEDSVTMQKVFEMTFGAEDVTVTSVSSGEEAISRAREMKPDVVIADLSLPGKNGYDICAALRADASLGDVPVLLLHGSASSYDEPRALSVKADGDICKPFETQAVIDRIKALVERRRPAPKEAKAPMGPIRSLSSPIGSQSGDIIIETEVEAPAAPSHLTPAPVTAEPAFAPVSPAPRIPAPPLGKAVAPIPPLAAKPLAAPPGVSVKPGAARVAPLSALSHLPVAAKPAPVPVPAPIPALAPKAKPAAGPPTGVPAGTKPVAPAGRASVPGISTASAPSAPLSPKRPPPPMPKPRVPAAQPVMESVAEEIVIEAEPPPLVQSELLPSFDTFERIPVVEPAQERPAPSAPAPSVSRAELPPPPPGMPLPPARAPISAAAVAPAAPAPRVPAALRAEERIDPAVYEVVAKLSREIIERVVWEVVPDLAEKIIREELERLVESRRVR